MAERFSTNESPVVEQEAPESKLANAILGIELEGMRKKMGFLNKALRFEEDLTKGAFFVELMNIAAVGNEPHIAWIMAGWAAVGITSMTITAIIAARLGKKIDAKEGRT